MILFQGTFDQNGLLRVSEGAFTFVYAPGQFDIDFAPFNVSRSFVLATPVYFDLLDTVAAVTADILPPSRIVFRLSKKPMGMSFRVEIPEPDQAGPGNGGRRGKNATTKLAKKKSR